MHHTQVLFEKKHEIKYAVELDEFGWYNYTMYYRRGSVFCRVWLNSKTFTHAIFLTHGNHATHAKILTHATHVKILWTHDTHATHVTHAKMLWTHATHATHAKVWPMPPTLPRHPRDLADSFGYHSD